MESRENGYAYDDLMTVIGFIVWASERGVTEYLRYCMAMGG